MNWQPHSGKEKRTYSQTSARFCRIQWLVLTAHFSLFVERQLLPTLLLFPDTSSCLYFLLISLCSRLLQLHAPLGQINVSKLSFTSTYLHFCTHSQLTVQCFRLYGSYDREEPIGAVHWGTSRQEATWREGAREKKKKKEMLSVKTVLHFRHREYFFSP